MIYDNYIYFSKILDPFFLIYFSIINIIYVVLLILGSYKIFHRQKELLIEDKTYILQSNSLPEITFIVPAYNEEKRILITIESLLHLTYRSKQIILVNDGSTDSTFQLIAKEYQLEQVPREYSNVIPTTIILGVYRSKTHPEIFVIDKENGQKFDALNAGLNACKTSYCITIDADTFVDDKGFETIIRPILINPQTVAVGACVRIRNGCTVEYNRIYTSKFPINYTSAMQCIEYLRTFLMRPGLDSLGGNWGISGAFSVFATKALVTIGGFGPTFANDLEIILRLHHVLKLTKTPYQIVYLPDPVAWTEAPSDLKTLRKQRIVWQRGTLESIWFHKSIFFNMKYGAFGIFSFPFLVFGEGLEPLVELSAYIYLILGLILGIINIPYTLLLLGIIWGLVALFSLFCLLVDELSYQNFSTRKSITSLIFYTLIENLGYRQRTVFWRIQGFFSFFRRFPEIIDDTKHVKKTIQTAIKKREIKW